MYYNHSGYPGGLRERTARTMIERYPVEMVERAVKGMLPKIDLVDKFISNYLFMLEVNINIKLKNQKV